ncbi:MAG: hypothetical protein HC767_08275 [Akkermansiaceae bacterium]|nr:hypothetical protein [Akkermansiaceae bacterium]
MFSLRGREVNLLGPSWQSTNFHHPGSGAQLAQSGARSSSCFHNTLGSAGGHSFDVMSMASTKILSLMRKLVREMAANISFKFFE